MIQGASQFPPLVVNALQLYVGGLLFWPEAPPAVTGCEALSGFEFLQTNLGPEANHELLNGMFRMIQ